MTRYEETCNLLRAYWEARGHTFSPPTSQNLINAMNAGDTFRVKVRTTYAGGATHERWGFVTMTGGWQPSFMLMRRRGQHGSSDLLSSTDQIVDSKTLRR